MGGTTGIPTETKDDSVFNATVSWAPYPRWWQRAWRFLRYGIPDVPQRWRRRWLARQWPYALIKASEDYFDYALGLTDGTVIRFAQATPECGGRWVSLTEPVVCMGSYPETQRTFGRGNFNPDCEDFTFERGMSVPLSLIVWVCDAPQGS